MRSKIIIFITFLLVNVFACVTLSIAQQSQNLPYYYNYVSSKEGILGISSIATPTLMSFAGSNKGTKGLGTIGIVSTPAEVLALALTAKNHRDKSYMDKKPAVLPSVALPPASLPKEDISSTPKNKPRNIEIAANTKKMPPFSSASLPSQKLASQQTWRLERGPLRPQLMLWSEQSGYQLVWKASNDFSMETASKFNGKFLEAMEKLFAALQQSGGHALRVTVYEANKVITISEN